MILQALYEYYQRKAADPESNIAPQGWEWKEIPFILVIDRLGKFVHFKDTREGEGKARRGRTFSVSLSLILIRRAPSGNMPHSSRRPDP